MQPLFQPSSIGTCGVSRSFLFLDFDLDEGTNTTGKAHDLIKLMQKKIRHTKKTCENPLK